MARPGLTAPSHEPQVQGGNVGVTDEDLRIVPKNFWLKVRQHSHCAVASGSTDHRFDSRIEPHAHEIRCASLVFLSLKATKLRDVGIENYFVACTLERFYSAVQWP